MSKPGPWAAQGACVGMDSDIFFRSDRYSEAGNICRSCLVIEECAAYAVENETDGFWGGLAPAEREELR